MVREHQWEASKKLTEAARYLFHGGPTNLSEQAAALNIKGLPDEALEPQDFEVELDCWEAVQMFARLMTQWRMGPAGPLGLDYGAAQWLFSLYSVSKPRQLLEDLQRMEATWLDEFWKGRS